MQNWKIIYLLWYLVLSEVPINICKGTELRDHLLRYLSSEYGFCQYSHGCRVGRSFTLILVLSEASTNISKGPELTDLLHCYLSSPVCDFCQYSQRA